MKNKSFKRRLPDFFRQRVHDKVSFGNMPTLGKPESEQDATERFLEDLLRWADDGGQILDIDHSLYPFHILSPHEPSDHHGS